MPYGKCVILEEETKKIGTELSELTKGSRKKIVIKCEECDVITTKEFRGFSGIHICKTIIDNNKKCFKCKQKKDVSEFSKNRKSHDGYSKCCKVCYANYESVKRYYQSKSNKIKTDIKTYFIHKARNLRSISKTKNLPFDLTGEWLYELYLKQDKKCYYTGIDIFHNNDFCEYDSISVDKKNPDNGYTKENVVLCCFSINSFKGQLNELQFKNFIQTITPHLIKWSEN